MRNVLAISLALVVAFAAVATAKDIETRVPMAVENEGARTVVPGGAFGVDQGADTFYYGGTVWDAAELRWEAASPASAGWTNRKMWTFSAGGFNGVPHSGSRMDGWKGVDNRWQFPGYFDVKDNAALGATCVIAGTKSLFCGATNAECYNLCFVDYNGTGYGNSWNQGVYTPTYTWDSVYDQASLSYQCAYESEPAFDFTYVILQVYDTVGGEWIDQDTLVEYSDVGSATETFDLDVAMSALTPPVDFRIVFQFVSDVSYSDLDGLNPTECGAFAMDTYSLNNNGTVYSENFETTAVGGLPAGWGHYAMPCGDYAQAAHLNDLAVNLTADPCVAAVPGICEMADSVIILCDLSTPGYPHPLCQDNYVMSPVVDFSDHPGLPGRILDYEAFHSLPLNDHIFMYWQVRYKPGCVSGGWSQWVNDLYVYYSTEGTRCAHQTFDISTYVPPEAEQAQLGLGVLNYCEEDPWALGCTHITNVTPYYDNITFGVFGSNVAPYIAVRDQDYFQDQFAEDGTLDPTSTADTRTAANQGYLALPIFGDTMVCRGISASSEVWLSFRMAAVSPKQTFTAPFFTWFPNVQLGGWFEARMDTAEVTDSPGAGTVVIPGTYMTCFHEGDVHALAEGTEILPNNVFMPGTRIEYYLKSCYVGSADTFYLPSEGPSAPEEFEILPMMMDDGAGSVEWPCLIVADHFGQRGNGGKRNSDRIASYLAENGYDFDVFNKLAPSSGLKNGIGRYSANGGQIGSPGTDKYNWGPGATSEQFAAYTHCILNAGSVYGYCVTEPDVALLTTWLVDYGSVDFPQFLWVSGDRATRELNRRTPWGRSFLNDVLCVAHLGSDYNSQYGDFQYCGPMNGIVGGRLFGIPGLEDFVLRESGCYRRFSRIGPSSGGTAVSEVEFDGHEPDAVAAVSNAVVTASCNYKTLTEGYDFCLMRDDNSQGYPACGPETAPRKWTDDVLNWGNLGKTCRMNLRKVPPLKPDTVYVFNSVGDGTDHVSQLSIFQRMGFLGPHGEYPTTQGDLLKNSEGKTVGRVIRAPGGGGEVIGWSNGAVGGDEAYDLSSSATFDYAMSRIGLRGGCVEIDKHGNVGMVVLDRGSQFAGCGPKAGGGGTGVPGLPTYGITAPAGPTTVLVNSCYSNVTPAGGTSVVESVHQAAPALITAEGHDTTAACKLDIWIDAPNKAAWDQAFKNLRDAAFATGDPKFRNDKGETTDELANAWICSLPVDQQHSTAQRIADQNSVATLTYVTDEPPKKENQKSMNVDNYVGTIVTLPVYHVDPTLIGPEGGCLAFRDDTTDIADDVKIEAATGVLSEYRAFWIRGIPNDSEQTNAITVGGIFELTPLDSLPCVDSVTVTMKYLWPVSEQLNVFRKSAGGTWDRILDGRSVQVLGDSIGTISVNVTRLGRFAVLVDSGAIGIGVAPQAVRFALFQSYPNPFNPLCTIRYQVATRGKVTIRVFDVRGAVVRTVRDSWREPGVYSEVWDGKHDDGRVLPSGVYFYRLEAGDFVATRKMVLLR